MSGGEARLLGRWGEALVAEDLRRRGFRILEAGYRSRFGEIDLIAENGRYLTFTEVKLRSSEDFAPGRSAVDARKQARLRSTAQLWLAEHPENTLQPRFDVAEVLAPQGIRTAKPKIQYIEDAF